MAKYIVDYTATRNRQIVYAGTLSVEAGDNATEDELTEAVHAQLAEMSGSPDFVTLNSFQQQDGEA